MATALSLIAFGLMPALSDEACLDKCPEEEVSAATLPKRGEHLLSSGTTRVGLAAFEAVNTVMDLDAASVEEEEEGPRRC